MRDGGYGRTTSTVYARDHQRGDDETTVKRGLPSELFPGWPVPATALVDRRDKARLFGTTSRESLFYGARRPIGPTRTTRWWWWGGRSSVSTIRGGRRHPVACPSLELWAVAFLRPHHRASRGGDAAPSTRSEDLSDGRASEVTEGGLSDGPNRRVCFL